MLSIRFLGIQGENYRFEFHCTECGGYEINVEDSGDDASPVRCTACRAPFGSYGKVKEEARQRALSQAPPDAASISGWRFVATLQLRTPLRVLDYHGLMFPGPFSEIPEIISAPWQGVWVPKTKSFRELGLDIPEFPPATMASEIGYVPVDGGEFLPFLIGCRRIIEYPKSAADRRLALTDYLDTPRWREIVLAIGGPAAALRHVTD